MSDLTSLYRVLDQLIDAHATRADEGRVHSARAAFEARRGRLFEDEELWEMASRIFVECFVLEGIGEEPPAAIELDADGPDVALVRAWLRSLRSLYQVTALDSTVVDLADLAGGGHYRVQEPRSFRGVSPGDVIEARLVGYGEYVYFGRGFVFHPSGSTQAIVGHIASIRDAGGSRMDAANFCAGLRVRCERYGHVTPLRVYETAVVKPDRADYGVDASPARPSETPAS